MSTKKQQIINLLSTHKISEIVKIVNTSDDYIRKVANQENIAWIKNDLKVLERKILDHKHLPKSKIKEIVGCSRGYINKVFAAHGIDASCRKAATKAIVADLAKTLSVAEIAKKLRIQKSTVRDYMRKQGLESAHKKKTSFLIEQIKKLGVDHTISEIAQKLGQKQPNIRRIVSKHNIQYVKVQRRKDSKSDTKSITAIVMELAPDHSVEEIVSKTNARRKYVTTILKKIGYGVKREAKPILKKIKSSRPRRSSKTVSDKIKITQSDMQKGNLKSTCVTKVMPTAVRDEGRARVVMLDSKTTKIIYPGQKDYDTPSEVLRENWLRRKESGIKALRKMSY